MMENGNIDELNGVCKRLPVAGLAERKRSSMSQKEDAILMAVSSFAQGYRRRDVQGALAAFSATARLTAGDGQIYVGIDAISRRLSKELKSAAAQTIVPRRIQICCSNDEGRVESTYDMIDNSALSNARVTRGQFTAELTSRGNRWEIDSAHFAVSEDSAEEGTGPSRLPEC